jgi:hypothetical protein
MGIHWWEVLLMAEEYEVNFDLERMKEALKGPFITLPSGMKREELRAWLKLQAEKLKQEQE